MQVPLECIHLPYAYDIAPCTIHTASNQLLILSSIHFWQPSFLLVEFLQHHVLVPFTTCTLSHLKDIMWFSTLQQPLALYLGRDSKVQRGGTDKAWYHSYRRIKKHQQTKGWYHSYRRINIHQQTKAWYHSYRRIDIPQHSTRHGIIVTEESTYLNIQQGTVTNLQQLTYHGWVPHRHQPFLRCLDIIWSILDVGSATVMTIWTSLNSFQQFEHWNHNRSIELAVSRSLWINRYAAKLFLPDFFYPNCPFYWYKGKLGRNVCTFTIFFPWI